MTAGGQGLASYIAAPVSGHNSSSDNFTTAPENSTDACSQQLHYCNHQS